MSFVGDLFNSSKGAGFTGTKADVLQPVNQQQLQHAYDATQGGLSQQQDFVAALQGLNGVQNLGNVFNQQQNFANQLQTQANGGGPNPALAQLNQATGQNVANQAALMAGQRGTAANPGMLARQVAQQGSNIQQQAGGQAAILRAQQQLANQQALQQQQAMLGNTANTQVGQQASALGNFNNMLQNQQGQLLNATGQMNNANISNQANVNDVNGRIAQGNQQAQAGLTSGALQGAGSFIGLAEGGPVRPTPTPAPLPVTSNIISGQDSMRKAFHYAEGGPVSFVGQYFNQAKPMAEGGNVYDFTSGGKLPGKAEIKGDSYQNDKVPIMGSPGEIMLPRSVTMHKDAPKKAAEFVAAIIAKNGMGKK